MRGMRFTCCMRTGAHRSISTAAKIRQPPEVWSSLFFPYIFRSNMEWSLIIMSVHRVDAQFTHINGTEFDTFFDIYVRRTQNRSQKLNTSTVMVAGHFSRLLAGWLAKTRGTRHDGTIFIYNLKWLLSFFFFVSWIRQWFNAIKWRWRRRQRRWHTIFWYSGNAFSSALMERCVGYLVNFVQFNLNRTHLPNNMRFTRIYLRKISTKRWDQNKRFVRANDYHRSD